SGVGGNSSITIVHRYHRDSFLLGRKGNELQKGRIRSVDEVGGDGVHGVTSIDLVLIADDEGATNPATTYPFRIRLVIGIDDRKAERGSPLKRLVMAGGGLGKISEEIHRAHRLWRVFADPPIEGVGEHVWQKAIAEMAVRDAINFTQRKDTSELAVRN